MSTRSGRRIHSSVFNIEDPNTELITKSVRKTRSKRQKENCEELPSVLKNKGRYVHYPGDEEIINEADDNLVKSTRKLRRHTLKDHNIITNTENSDKNIGIKKHKGKTKKIVDDIDNTKSGFIDHELESVTHKVKKHKKKKENVIETTEINDEGIKETVSKSKKQGKKKRNRKRSNSIKEEDVCEEVPKNTILNMSNASADSFHSAAGSPATVVHNGATNHSISAMEESKIINNVSLSLHESNNKSITPKLSKSKNSTFVKDSEDECGTPDGAKEKKKSKRKRKSHIKDISFNKSKNIIVPNNDSFVNENPDDSINKCAVLEKLISSSERKSLHTQPQNGPNSSKSNLNGLSEMTLRHKVTKSLDSTFDKESTVEMNATFDKDSNTNRKSNLQGLNLTFDKCHDKSNIKINNEDSQGEDIVNFTPEFITNNKDESKTENSQKSLIQTTNEENIKEIPNTPLKREGTFTMESPKTIQTPKAKTSKDKTSKQSTTLASPGCTPFPVNKSTQKDKTALNVTHSIEKSLRRSSLTEVIPKTMKVMFSSPANDSVIVSQIKRKVIKSNLKRSNTSFVVEESSLEPTRPAARKRSYTQNDAEDIQIKRSKPGEEILLLGGRNTRAKTFNTRVKEHIIRKRMSHAEETMVDKTGSMLPNDVTCHDGSSEKKFDSTFEKNDPKDSLSKDKYPVINTLISSSERKSLRLKSKSLHTLKTNINGSIDTAADKLKHNQTKSLDSTYNTGSIDQINTTFDKDQCNLTGKSDTANLTFDKSNNSHISINSDDSKVENIVNLTPELINSSTDESMNQNSPKSEVIPTDRENIKEVPVTPLKREDTFTMESPKAIETPKPKISNDGTPNRRKSVASPGCTPFPGNKSAQKDKTVLNLTHSIEKSLRRSSLTEPIPRTTKVMFCSPVNNPAIASQVKRKVIKSNLKGSNKSFIFDESLSDTTRRVARKRSYTQSDAEDVQIRSTRLGEEMQQSVDRLSRPRTFSATAKLSEPTTPSKKTVVTPSKSRPESRVKRTKLPNFAALHQKQFEKMESLDECQERKAKRARQLLTPTGSLNLIERISPKEKVPESPKRAPAKEQRKPDTPHRPKLPTLDSINPGYTRFGFKMNYHVNPFHATNKLTETKTKENKPNGTLIRQATLPSLAGATSVRREAAKQTIMREKSFTEKRDVKRKEYRTVIKGVRTNRRFELQMRMRDLN